MGDANLQLSTEETRLIMDAEWILTKNSVMAKIVAMMAALSEEWRVPAPEEWMPAGDGDPADPGGTGDGGPGATGDGSIGDTGPAGTGEMGHGLRGPKISKGENYKGLPWVMLDYPRIFGKEDVLAIRTMFWWGHSFSVTLHLKGKYMRVWMPAILRHREELAAAGFRLGVSEDEWEHAEEAYRPWDEGIPAGKDFFKLSAHCGLDQWNKAPEILTVKFRALLRVLGGRGSG